MGACDFSVIIHARTAEEAFDIAVQEAQYEHGHGGYTGTIAEKSDFVMIEDTWKDIRQRFEKKVKFLKETIKWAANTPTKDLTRDMVTSRLAKAEVPLWISDGKTQILKELRQTTKKFMEFRNACRPNMSPMQIADHLMYQFRDSRVDDKWGPAGCIDLDPNLTGKRKNKRFFFFGLASS